MTRVVSLLPSATEIVCALGFRDRLVGRSHECDFPVGVEALPVVTRSKLEASGDSAEIDRQVKSLLEQGLSIYAVDADRLRALQPQVIVTQSQCEACAVSFNDVAGAVASWTGDPVRVVSLEANALEDVFADVDRVARALDVPERGAALVAGMRASMAAIAERTQKTPSRPTVAMIEWIEPLMAAGNWIPTLVDMAGGASLFGAAGKHSPWMSWDDLVDADPDILAIAPCGFDIPRAKRELAPLVERPGWRTLSAVRNDRVYLADGCQYFNRPGPRLVESLEILAEMLHPESFGVSHEGVGWRRL